MTDGLQVRGRTQGWGFALTSLPLYPLYKKAEVKASPHAALRPAHRPAPLQHEGFKDSTLQPGEIPVPAAPTSPKTLPNFTVPQFPQVHPKEHQHIAVPAWIPPCPYLVPAKRAMLALRRKSRIQQDPAPLSLISVE